MKLSKTLVPAALRVLVVLGLLGVSQGPALAAAPASLLGARPLTVAEALAIDPSTVPILRFAEVTPGRLYRGARPTQEGLAALAAQGFKTVVDLEDDTDVVDAERAMVEGLGMTFISKPMSGFWAPNDAEVDSILAILADGSNGPLFVHCQHGQDRTGLIVALHRVFAEGWTPAAARQEMLDHGFHTLLVFLNHYFETKTGYED